MADFVVHRGADALGEAPVVERRRVGALLEDEVVHFRVDIVRGPAHLFAACGAKEVRVLVIPQRLGTR